MRKGVKDGVTNYLSFNEPPFYDFDLDEKKYYEIEQKKRRKKVQKINTL
jgi:hypothetical protein